MCVCVFFAFILQSFSVVLCGGISGQRYPRDPVLYNPLRVLFRMLRWVAEHAVPPLSIFLPTTDGGLGHENMAWQFFPQTAFHFAVYLRHLFTTEAKAVSPLESAVHSITWFH